jgi:hypothetical protein
VNFPTKLFPQFSRTNIPSFHFSNIPIARPGGSRQIVSGAN